MGLEGKLSGFAIAEIVDENMANAARVHAIEWGKDIAARSMIAFGGAAPLHAARLAEKLEVGTVVVPTGAGVGSAIGFLRAPISYEVVRSRYMRLGAFRADAVNALLEEMEGEARGIVQQGAGAAELSVSRVAYMRYVGQGHEITVDLPAGALTEEHAAHIRSAFETEYAALYGRTIPGQEPEILSWTLTVSAPITTEATAAGAAPEIAASKPVGSRQVFDPDTRETLDYAIHARDDLKPGMTLQGPALIVEDQTTTVVTSPFDCAVNALGYLILTRVR